MIYAEDLLKQFRKKNIVFYTGVPDSILKSLSFILEKKSKKNHITATNEGSAISIAIGYHLSTKKIPCVYLQNSGLGNAINPLISLAHNKVYSIPMILLIGWRGSPKTKDEPQHKAKGAITKKLLRLLNINYCELNINKDLKKISKIINISKKKNMPIAFLVKNQVLKSKILKLKTLNRNNFLRRNEVINEIFKNIKNRTNIISTTGFTSRELMQIRNIKKHKNGNDFYMVGGMGHTAAVSLGISLNTKKETICLDGDGAVLMHLGSLSTVGFFANKNFKHVLFNNNSHESVGGQITHARKINFKNLSKSLGYKKYFLIKNKNNLKLKLRNFFKAKGPVFMEVIINRGSVKNLMRPKNLLKIKKKFMNLI